MSRVRHQYQAARWDEPLIYELGSPGERSVFPPSTESEIAEVVGDPLTNLPEDLQRCTPVDLPELSEPQVLRHYTRLSQMCLGVDVAVDMTGTCTMKYSPKVNELITRTLRYFTKCISKGETRISVIVHEMLGNRTLSACTRSRECQYDVAHFKHLLG